MKNKISLLKKAVLIAVILYAVITFINQQKILNSYAAQEEIVNEEIEEATEYQEELIEQKDNVNSQEYIESAAREKLDMYYPNERVYINSEN